MFWVANGTTADWPSPRSQPSGDCSSDSLKSKFRWREGMSPKISGDVGEHKIWKPARLLALEWRMLWGEARGRGEQNPLSSSSICSIYMIPKSKLAPHLGSSRVLLCISGYFWIEIQDATESSNLCRPNHWKGSTPAFWPKNTWIYSEKPWKITNFYFIPNVKGKFIPVTRSTTYRSELVIWVGERGSAFELIYIGTFVSNLLFVGRVTGTDIFDWYSITDICSTAIWWALYFSRSIHFNLEKYESKEILCRFRIWRQMFRTIRDLE